MTQKAMNIPSDVPTRKLRFISHSAPISPMPRIAPKRRPLILAKCSRFNGFMCGVHFSAFDMASVPFLSFFLSFSRSQSALRSGIKFSIAFFWARAASWITRNLSDMFQASKARSMHTQLGGGGEFSSSRSMFDTSAGRHYLYCWWHSHKRNGFLFVDFF